MYYACSVALASRRAFHSANSRCPSSLSKRLEFPGAGHGPGLPIHGGELRALVKACVNRPASCPLPPEAGCPGGAPFIAIHVGVVSEILCIQLSVGGGPSYLLGGF